MRQIHKILILFLLLTALTANAADIVLLSGPVQIQQESFFAKVWRCKLNLYCYRQNLGASITTIAATDLIKDSRATINTNFTNLNDGKIENATTSLPSVTTMAGLTSAASLVTIGTITTGTWNASTLTVSYGGTGSSTLSQYRILLGNGSSALTVATSTGTAGQFLVSNGEGANPSWQTKSTDVSTNYTWTGLHTFNTYSLNIASSTKINSITNVYPASQGASSTMLQNDGSGNLTWNLDSWGELLAATSTPVATSTITVTIPARRDLRIVVDIPGSVSDGVGLRFNLDNGTNYGWSSVAYTNTDGVSNSNIPLGPNTSSSTARYFDIRVKNQTSIAKRVSYTGLINAGQTATYAGLSVSGAGVWNNTSAQITSVSLQMGTLTNTLNANTSLSVYGSRD